MAFCIKCSSSIVSSLNDLHAEWTGGLFDTRGKAFYVSVQHNATSHGVILKVTGWGNAHESHHGWQHRGH
jgi:hypothetical protein